MNDKKQKHDKSTRKSLGSKSKDGSTEIFVLPPNLLQQLGIDLGNVNPPQDGPTNTDLVMPGNQIINKQPEISSYNDIAKTEFDETIAKKETSILETAILMKKSVLLSPTFISNAENSLLGELEISNQNSISPNTLSFDKHEICKDYVKDVVTNERHDTVDKIMTNLQFETKSNARMPEQLSNLDNREIKTLQQIKQLPFNVIDQNPSKNNVGGNIITDILAKNLSIDEHPDEAYSSDYSNSNPGPLENVNTLIDNPIPQSFNSDTRNNSKKAINILSEEVLGPSELKQFKCRHTSQISNLIPININSYLAGNKIIVNDYETASADKIVTPICDQTFQSILNDEPSDGSSETSLEAARGTNMIQSTNFNDEMVMTNVNVMSKDTYVQDKHFNNKYDLISSKEAQVEHSSLDTNASVIKKSNKRKSDTESSDNSFGVCIDIVVTDIEKNLEDNDEILNKFVNEIKYNDEQEMLNNMEISGKELPNKCIHQKDILQISTSVKTSSSHHAEVHSKDINKDENLTNMTQNTITDHSKGLPFFHKTIKVRSMSTMNTQIEDERNGRVENKRNSEMLIGSKNSKPKSIETHKCSDTEIDMDLTPRSDNIKKIRSDAPKDSESYQQSRNTVSLLHNTEKCRKNVKLDRTNSNNVDDKVEIIADYLSRCSHLYSNKRKLKLKTNTNSSYKAHTNQSNHNTSKLKLCIEGVEKPGGLEENEQNSKKSRVLKTYGNNNRCKRSYTSTLPTSAPQDQALMNFSENLENESNSISFSENLKLEEFCLCGDFGRLAYYECDSLYEHIHFWDHQNIICNPEIIFSIYDEHHQLYDENVDLSNENVTNLPNIACDKSIRTGQTICWNCFERHDISNRDFEICDRVSETLLSETEECITKVDNITCQNESKTLLVAKNTDQHENLVQLTSLPNLVKDKINGTDSGSIIDTKNREQHVETLQPKVLPNLVETTSNENVNVANFVATSNKDHGDLHIPEDTLTNEVVSVIVLVDENTEQQEDAVQVGPASEEQVPKTLEPTQVVTQENLPKPVEMTSSVSTTMFDDKNTEKRDSLIGDENVQTSDVNYKMVVGKIAGTESKKIGKKRKKASQQQDKYEPLAKKTVKCGVCEQLLVETEWEDHIAEQHCFIAWKTGDSIDFQNQELSKKLQQRLNSSGSLKCTFCDVEIRSKNKYLTHVQKCSKDSANSTKTSESIKEEIGVGASLECGVCGLAVTAENWIKHISEEHNYLAWKAGEPALSLNDEDAIRRHLSDIVKQFGGLVCHKCGLTRKYGKSYLQHVKNCTGNEDSFDNATIETTPEKAASTSTSSEVVKCGVCAQDVIASKWISHIAKDHDYLAWRDGEAALDLNNEEQIRQHLNDISKESGGLSCSKCGLIRKYIKSYLHHTKSCDFVAVANDDLQLCNAGDISNISKSNTSLNASFKSLVRIKRESPVKCGVCQMHVKSEEWLKHIEKEHNYLAWIDGETLNIENAEEVQSHLRLVAEENGGLACAKCGIVRRYVKNYLSHVETCDATQYDEDKMRSMKENIECGICHKEVTVQDWQKHKMRKHYNVAWADGDTPVDMNSPYVVERFLKEYKNYYKKLECHVCGISRVSYIGFYAHVLVCGKTDEETEVYKSICDICKKKYLQIYHSQHMAAHREQVYAKERKLKRQSEQVVSVKVEVEAESPSTGRRKAAEKANIVIQNYKKNASQYKHICPTCGFGTDSNSQLAVHTCEKTSAGCSDSDVSVKLEGEESDDASLESDIDSNISDDEDQAMKKRTKPVVSSTIQRMPFTVKSPSTYLLKSGEEFCKYHFTDESLFIEWRGCEYESVPEDQLSMYLPPLEQSCNVKVCDDIWKTHNRFEAQQYKDKVCSTFVGASVQCVSWAPARCDAADGGTSYLAVACHRGADCPRHAPDELRHHAGHIQLWDYGNFESLPKMVLCLAHDFGTVWSMGWCPSGARDARPQPAEARTTSRLGLLAVACSTGSAYIFSVPYPSTVTQSNKLFYKLKPVAELRVSTGAHRTYQATCLSWSQQKGHSDVVVGYGDGTTAHYDLNTDSPLLRTKENNVTVLYPYHDERPHNSCVTGVDVFASSRRGGGGGAVCSAAPTGTGVAARAGLRPARLQSHLAASVAVFQPHWPSVILAGDDSVVSASANELEWWGGGRRFGPVRACCGCARCARVALSTPPVLRLARAHPAYTDHNKQTIGCLQMTRLGKKRKKLANDDLATKIEPLTYEEAVKKYGIELKLDKKYQVTASQPRDQCPERFPLADVPSMALCPAAAHHDKLAVATHAGVVFLITL